jgi:hypothetical protein
MIFLPVLSVSRFGCFSLLAFLGFVLLITSVHGMEAPHLKLPPRPPSAPTGTDLRWQLEDLPLVEREERLFLEISLGNVPAHLRRFTSVTLQHKELLGQIWALPDYLSVGADEDFFLMPMTPFLAQRVADLTSTTLPTRAMVDGIWRAATVKLDPQPILPSPAMVTVPVFWDHHSLVMATRRQLGFSFTELTAGHKKDVVITPRLYQHSPGARVAIYGWHRADRRPIQPLFLGHGGNYADYSHGIRLIHSRMILNGQSTTVESVLLDSALAPLLNDESSTFTVDSAPRYPLPESQP